MLFKDRSGRFVVQQLLDGAAFDAELVCVYGGSIMTSWSFTSASGDISPALRLIHSAALLRVAALQRATLDKDHQPHRQLWLQATPVQTSRRYTRDG